MSSYQPSIRRSSAENCASGVAKEYLLLRSNGNHGTLKPSQLRTFPYRIYGLLPIHYY